MEGNVESLKSSGGQMLAVGIAVLVAAAAVFVVLEDEFSAVLTVWPWLALVLWISWGMYWRPEVSVSDSGVRLVNVTRTIDVPWPALRSIDTKWALTLHTEWGRFRAWAAPAPGRSAMRREMRFDSTVVTPIGRRVPGMPTNTVGRPADLTHADSGAAAALVNSRWQRIRSAGYLDTPVIEHDRAPVRWHWELLAGAAVLAALGVVGITV